MKKLLTFLGLLAIVATVNAQFVPRPQGYSLFTNLTAILIEGSSTSNAPVTMCNILPVGKNGNAFYFVVGGTNAATTTNATILVESVVIDSKTGRTNVIDNQTYTISLPQNGTTPYEYLTNIINTTANLGNAFGLRLRSIQNTNLASIWITNATTYIRE